MIKWGQLSKDGGVLSMGVHGYLWLVLDFRMLNTGWRYLGADLRQVIKWTYI